MNTRATFRCTPELIELLDRLGDRSDVIRAALLVALAETGHPVAALLRNLDLGGIADPALRARAARLADIRSTVVRQTSDIMPLAPVAPVATGWGAGEEF
jgi:Arc/MetJ-type ribon-helix-helix transcriptional regulator